MHAGGRKNLISIVWCLGNDFLCILPTLEGWVYRVSYTWASMGYTSHMGHSHIYTLTPPAVWTTGAAVYKTGQQRKTHTQGPPQPQLATGYVEAGPELREGRGRKTLGEDVSELGGGRYMENPNIANSHRSRTKCKSISTCFVR
jgi:hypothetical protein